MTSLHTKEHRKRAVRAGLVYVTDAFAVRPDGRFIGRIQTGDGPSPMLVVDGQAFDMAEVAPTVSALVERGDFSAVR